MHLRTTEKNIQLYHQLSGRAGRFSSNSLIIYQTLSPKDVTLNELIKNNIYNDVKETFPNKKVGSAESFNTTDINKLNDL